MFGAQRGQRFAGHRRAWRHLGHALPQFLGAEQIGVAPGRTLRGIAELLERIGEHRARGLVIRFGKHQMADRLRDEAEFAVGKVLLCTREDRVRAAHILDIFLA